MKNKIALAQNNAAGFGLFWPLVFIIFVGFIIAAVMQLLTIWAAAGLFILTIVVIVFVASLSDIMRYLKISSM